MSHLSSTIDFKSLLYQNASLISQNESLLNQNTSLTSQIASLLNQITSLASQNESLIYQLASCTPLPIPKNEVKRKDSCLFEADSEPPAVNTDDLGQETRSRIKTGRPNTTNVDLLLANYDEKMLIKDTSSTDAIYWLAKNHQKYNICTQKVDEKFKNYDDDYYASPRARIRTILRRYGRI